MSVEKLRDWAATADAIIAIAIDSIIRKRLGLIFLILFICLTSG
jgi:uncharacterized membrane protein